MYTGKVRSLFIQEVFTVRYLLKMIHVQTKIKNGKLCIQKKVRSIFIQKMVRISYLVKIINNVQTMIKMENYVMVQQIRDKIMHFLIKAPNLAQ